MVLPLSASPSASPIVRAGLWAVDVALADLHAAAKLHAVDRRSASGTQIRDVIVRSGGVSIQAMQPIASAKAFVLSGPPRLVVDIYLRSDGDGKGSGTAKHTPDTSIASENAVAAPVASAPPGHPGASLQARAAPRFGVEGDRYRTVLALPIMPAQPPTVRATLWAVDVEVPGFDVKSPASHVPEPKSPSARAIRDVIIRPGGVSVRMERPVGSAHAFLLAKPPRLVVDFHPAPSVAVALAGPDAGDSPRAVKNTSPPATAHAKRDAGGPGVSAAVMVLAAKDLEPARNGEARDHAAADARPTSGAVTNAAGAGSPSGGMKALARSAAEELAALAAVAAPATHARSADAGNGDEAVRGPEADADHATEGAGGDGEMIGVGAALAADGVAVVPKQGQEGQKGQAGQAGQEGQASGSRAGRSYHLDEFRGHPILWPELDAVAYSHADTAAATEKFLAPRRAALEALRQARDEPPIAADAEKPPAAPAPALLAADAPAAAHLLEADIVYLRALDGHADPFAAVALYRRAARVAPRFPDRDRARLMVGFADLAAGLVPEAEGDFLQIVRASDDPGVAALALLGAGRAARAAGHDDRAARLLRQAIALDPGSHGACHARGALGSILAESGRGMQALELFEEMRERCPAEIVRSPRMLLTHAAALAAAGQVKAAEDLLSALPELDGELFARRKFLEGDLAMATGTPDFARRAYELVRTEAALSPMVRGEATLRLARVEDELGRLQEARDLLRELAGQAPNVTLAARARALEAELLAKHGQHPEALALLDRTDALGPAGFAAAEAARGRIFPAWVADLRERGDYAGMLTVFFRYRGDGIARHLPPAEVVHIADAALKVGVPDLGMRILSPVHAQLRGPARTEARRILAEAALAKGENAQAEHLATEAARAAKSPEARAEAERLRAEALLQLGRVEEAARLLGSGRDAGRLLALAAGNPGQGGEAAQAIEALEGALAKPAEGTAAQPIPAAREGELENLLALAAAADRAGEHALAATALRTALRLSPEAPGAGVRYQLAHVESASASPAAAAATYADAAAKETDPLLARAAAASAAYYRALEERGPEGRASEGDRASEAGRALGRDGEGQ